MKLTTDLSKIHLVIGTALYNYQTPLVYAVSLLKALTALGTLGIQTTLKVLPGIPLATRAKNIIVADAVREEGATNFLMIDGDQEWTERTVLDLLAYTTIDQRAIYTAPYCAKSPIPQFHYPPTSIKAPAVNKFGCLKVQYGAGGFMMMHMDTLRALYDACETEYDEPARPEHKVKVLYQHTYCPQLVGDDVGLCKQAAALEIPTWVSLHHNVGHADGRTTYYADFKEYLRDTYNLQTTEEVT